MSTIITTERASPAPSSGTKIFYWVKAKDPKEGKHPGLPIVPNRNVHEAGMDITYDVPVTVRDGVKLYVDIFKPEVATEKLPVIFTFSPYGKHRQKTFKSFHDIGVATGCPEGEDFVSRYAAWEAPDPLVWTKKGYIVVNGDSRGSWASEGNIEIWGRQEGPDGYDIIEWLGTQPWSNGNVGMMGVSYLAVVQWVIAETNPPHLKCIVPWHGFSDLYRDYAYHGGIPETNFIHFTKWSCNKGGNLVEDWIRNLKEHTMMDDYFQTKTSGNLSKVQTPCLAVTDWGDQQFHTRGTINGYMGISSEHKWLLIHAQKKWRYFYEAPAVARQEAFLQRFLKNDKKAFDAYPPVEVEVRDRAWKGKFRREKEWPLARTQYTKLYLDIDSRKLAGDVPLKYSTVSYDSEVQDDCVDFHFNFESETEITGHSRLRLWVSAEKCDDMDIFIQLDKLDIHGNETPFLAYTTSDDGPMALGWQRVSHRELDLANSRTERPFHTHDRELLLRPGEIVPIDIEILATSVRFQPGEKLRIKIQGNDTNLKSQSNIGSWHKNLRNRGKHIIHSGPLHESYINIPVIPTA